jgi:hypothetical protein
MASAMLLEVYEKSDGKKVINILLNGKVLELNNLAVDANGMYDMGLFEDQVRPYLVESIEGAISQ